MMNFEEFTKEVADNIKSFLPEWYDNAKVEVEQMNKLNESYLGLRVSIPDENISPCLNLNGAYRAYENGVSIEQIMERAAYTITTPVPEVDTKAFLDYEQIKDKLFIRVSNYEKNQDALADIPHERVEDLAITYHILVEAIDDGVGSVTIHNGLMEQYGITQEQLHQDAVANSQKIMPPEITSMASIMENSMRAEMLMNGCSEDEIDEMIASVSAEVDMYVIRNESHVNGASAIFYPDMMDDVAKLMNGDFYIIPSSTDEVIVIPDDGNASVAYMNAMVNEVNSAEVSPEMRLGNEVYHYDATDKVFEKASAHEERMKQKSAEKETSSEKNSILKKMDDKKKEIAGAVKDTVTPKRAVEATI